MQRARHSSVSSQQIRHILLSNVCVLALGLAVGLGPSPASAKSKVKPKSQHAESEHVSKEPFGDIPKGPLQIFVSINQQKLHFYSAGVHVTDQLVATGVPGHLTPMGVFSIIERDRYHHSNIYDNAPMPFMERITWSGVALHEGSGVGHQASHGCIRMPHDFAARLWQLPTMGMRVIIARPELKPTEFADPRLFVHKDAPTAALPRAVKTAQSLDPSTKTDAADPPATATQARASAAPTKLAPQTLADAVKAAVTEATAPAIAAEPTRADAPTTGSAAIQPAQPTQTDPAATATAASAAPNAAARPTAAEQDKTAAASAAPSTAATQPAPVVPGEAGKTAATSAAITAPIGLDNVPLPLSKPAHIAKSDSGPIAIFISRREGKIFVRQNFTPVFDAPVKIEHPDQPLGTHVFTALDYLSDGSSFRWNVVSLPGEPARGETHSKAVKDAKGKHKREVMEERTTESSQPLSPLQTPQEVLARIEIPHDVVEQISQLIVPGSSLVVSDQGLGPETGSGTDFIVIAH